MSRADRNFQTWILAGSLSAPAKCKRRFKSLRRRDCRAHQLIATWFSCAWGRLGMPYKVARGVASRLSMCQVALGACTHSVTLHIGLSIASNVSLFTEALFRCTPDVSRQHWLLFRHFAFSFKRCVQCDQQQWTNTFLVRCAMARFLRFLHCVTTSFLYTVLTERSETRVWNDRSNSRLVLSDRHNYKPSLAHVEKWKNTFSTPHKDSIILRLFDAVLRAIRTETLVHELWSCWHLYTCITL